MKSLHFIKKISLLAVALLPLTSLLLTQPVGAVVATNISVGDISTLSNQQRTSAGLAPLSYSAQLTSAAYSKANHMIALNYWSHNGPDGSTPWTFINASGYLYTSAGENLAKDYSSSSGVVNGWMASPGHRTNLMNASYKDVGYAVVNGNLLGSPTTLVVAMYGTPQATTSPASVTQNTTTSSGTASQQSAPTTSTAQTGAKIDAKATEAKTADSASSKKNTNTAAKKSNNTGEVAGATSDSVAKIPYKNGIDKTSTVIISALITAGFLLILIRYAMIKREASR